MNNKTGPLARSVEERFWEKVDKNGKNGCWIWTAYIENQGYGMFTAKRNGKWRNIRAHRFIYELLISPIPPEKEIDHLCRNRSCVNPDHLETVSHKVNCQRGELGLKVAEINKQKSHCPQGHPYNPLNTHINKVGARVCKVCRRDRIRIVRMSHRLNSPNFH